MITSDSEAATIFDGLCKWRWTDYLRSKYLANVEMRSRRVKLIVVRALISVSGDQICTPVILASSHMRLKTQTWGKIFNLNLINNNDRQLDSLLILFRCLAISQFESCESS